MKAYSELLHRSAEKWGLPVLPGRPLIGLPPGDDHLGIVGNPYQPEPPPIVEVLEWRSKTRKHDYARINLFIFNEKWGYCLNVAERGSGRHYGPFLKFCDPYPSRQDAVLAAAREVMSIANGPELRAWARSLTKPVQLELFNLDAP